MLTRQDMAEKIASARVALEIRQSYSEEVSDLAKSLQNVVTEILETLGMSGVADFLVEHHVGGASKLSDFNVEVLIALEAALRGGLDETQISEATVNAAFTA